MSLKSLQVDPPVRIRIENCDSLDERAEIRRVNVAAFEGAEEADLVDQLRADGHVLVSLVADLGSHVVGHCMFSRMWINTSTGLVSAVALAPVSVHPNHQRQGVGSRLIQHGLELLRDQGEKVVIVVGHPAYYPRFGFSTSRAECLESPFPRDAFMALELTVGALEGIRGAVVYPPAFGV
jgi:putative acetyltransferase